MLWDNTPITSPGLIPSLFKVAARARTWSKNSE
jgi:hypothetical protein